jgi:ParB family chromosome partitioning protein
MANRHGLGRGLGALLPPSMAEATSVEVAGVQEIATDAINPNPQQPRKDFDINALNELAGSLQKSGLIQPVVVRKAGLGYQLIVGERRWRAAKIAGLTHIPAVVREVSDAESLELALVENLLREDLNPIEEAEAYQRLLAEFGWTQEELAERVSKDRSTISNCLRLLKLPEPIRSDLRSGRLTMGHARALLSLDSVTEQLRLREQRKRVIQPRRAARRSPELTALEDAFREALATRVRLVGNERHGRIEIAYASSEDLDRIAEILTARR